MPKEEEEKESSFERMAKDIQQIRNALRTLSKLGITRELMEIYIAHKTKLGRYKIRAVLDAQKEFLDNAIKK
jgi:vacuolar-type H+-ATPase subunit C/Vma6